MSNHATAPESPLLDRHGAASYLHVSIRQLDAWVASGKIRATKLGRLVRIHLDELDRIGREGI